MTEPKQCRWLYDPPYSYPLRCEYDAGHTDEFHRSGSLSWSEESAWGRRIGMKRVSPH